MNEVRNISSWLGKHQTVVVSFTDWCNYSMIDLFNSKLDNLWNNQSIPLITWQLFLCNYKSQPGVIKLVNNHIFDLYLDQFSDHLKNWLAGNDSIYGTDDDRRIYIRLAHEMNGNWYPWSQNSTPNEYISAWHYIHNIFTNKGMDSTRLQWIWSVNYADFGNYTAEDYWIGDNYTDWIGIDGYNFGASRGGTWEWPNEIYPNMIERIRKLSTIKPLSINEYGSTSIIHSGNVSNVTLKTEWLNQFCNFISDSEIKMASYFNIELETDWSIFGGTFGDSIWNNFKAYSAYRNCLQSDEWIQPNITNKRLITDEQFAGRL